MNSPLVFENDLRLNMLVPPHVYPQVSPGFNSDIMFLQFVKGDILI